ncbi:MAG: hypothetical protein JO256_12100 [Alphaproteobacteria bacterium]|nr:hypothetical protein [Alphaproteobacteria bacterium]
MEFLFELLGELILQIVFEFLAQSAFRALADPFRSPRNIAYSMSGSLLWGAIAGGLSLLVLRHSFIANHDLRLANMLFTPILAGCAMALLAQLRRQNGEPLVGLDRFADAFAFALGMAIVRYFLAT